MLLASLKTENEKVAFVNLAYSLAKADGSLDYTERALINIYLDEMGIERSGYQVRREPLSDLCHVFSDQYSKKIVFANLLSLACLEGYNSQEQRHILEIIQNELAISSVEAKRYEDEIKIVKGSYFDTIFDD